MKKFGPFFVFILVGITLSMFLLLCSDDDDDDDNMKDEFIAEKADFEGYSDWTKLDYAVYPVNRNSLSSAHMGLDSNFARLIYSNNKVNDDGTYQKGAVLVKETFSWTAQGGMSYAESGGLLGMTKRGGDFNKDHGNWEWFMLNPSDGSIEARGADLMDGMCNSCHSAAEKDYVFKHPSEFVLAEGEEATWFDNVSDMLEPWDSKVGPDDFLGSAHGINDDFVRNVYKWQPGAEVHDNAYPVGTIIIKKLIDQNTGEMPEAGGAITAMVKRGGSFNSEHGNWEWFMRGTDGTYARGGDLMNGMCNSCHAGAANAGGNDYVFPHLSNK